MADGDRTTLQLSWFMGHAKVTTTLGVYTHLFELSAAANQTAATMSATANEVVSMERAISSAPHSRLHLAPTITAFTTQLDHGARQYNEMVTAAAQLVSAANTGSMSSSPMSQQRYRDELVNATDRLMG